MNKYLWIFQLLHFVDVPHKTTDAAIDHFAEQLTELKEALEQKFDVKITDENLQDAVNTYNDTRDLLKQFYELRQVRNPPVTGAEALKVVLAGTVIPKSQYNELLRIEETLGDKAVYGSKVWPGKN